MAEPAPPRCDGCRHWQPYRSGDEVGSGECRRFPPVVVLVELAEFDGPKSSGYNAMNGTEWPQTGPAAWCGEWDAIAPPPAREWVCGCRTIGTTLSLDCGRGLGDGCHVRRAYHDGRQLIDGWPKKP